MGAGARCATPAPYGDHNEPGQEVSVLMLFRKRGHLLVPLITALGRGLAASSAIGLAEFLARVGG